MFPELDITFMSILPPWAITLVAGGLVLLLAHGCLILRRKKVPRRWIIYLAALRLAAVALFIACLLRPGSAIRSVESPIRCRTAAISLASSPASR